MEQLKCPMCRLSLTEEEKDARIFELEKRLHRIDSAVQIYIDGLITTTELAGIIRDQRKDIDGELFGMKRQPNDRPIGGRDK